MNSQIKVLQITWTEFWTLWNPFFAGLSKISRKCLRNVKRMRRQEIFKAMKMRPNGL